MATIFSPSAVLSSSSSSSTATTTATKASAGKPRPTHLLQTTPTTNSLSSALAAASAAAVLLSSTLPAAPLLAADPSSFHFYYGTASSPANYGGFGGNQNKQDTAEYVYEVPDGWKERLVSKIEKGTNGTDSEFFNPKKRTEKEYLTFLAGFRALAPMDAVLGNLALSDVDLQDLIATADSVKSEERRDEGGQVYYVYEIEGASGAHSLITVTCANNKLYAHFVSAPKPDWERDQDALRRIHQSFRTVRSS